MALSSPIPTKYEPQTVEDLRAMSDHTGLPVSALIRIAVKQKVDDWKRGEQIAVNPVRQGRRNRA